MMKLTAISALWFAGLVLPAISHAQWNDIVYSAPSSSLTFSAPKDASVCDSSLAKHIYHPKRLVTQAACVSVTGVWEDASHGKTKDGCRHEKDGDGHCWLKLDSGQEKYLNAENMKTQAGHLVVEPICIYRVTQVDAISACKGFKQSITLPAIGSHVRVTGVWVLDTQHGHMEIHPISHIDILPLPKK